MKPPTWTKWWSRNFSLLRFYVAMEAINSSFYKKHFNAHHTHLCVLPDGTFNAIYADRNEIQRMLENIYKVACDNFKTFEKYSEQIFQMMKAFLTLNKKLGTKNLSSHSRLQLLALFKQWHANYINWQVGIWFHFLLEPIVTEKFFSQLKRYAKIKGKLVSFEMLENSITAPEQMNAVTRESYGALKVAKKIKENLNQKEPLITAHYKKFLWIPCYDFKDREYDRTYFEKNIVKLLKLKRETIERRLSSFEKKFKKRKQTFKTVIKKIDDKRLVTVASIMHKLVFYKDYRDDLRRQTGYFGKPFLTALAKRLNITLEHINYLTPQEIEKGILGGALTREAITERMPSHYVLYNTRQGIRCFTGAEMQKIKRQQENEKIKQNALIGTVVTGTVASRGKAQGRVVIVRHTTDLKEVRREDIMVAVTTHPDYVPAMKKCAAVITDEGGITSHAAIVCRELHIPCIVGTKNATHIFETGDKIKVDAYKCIIIKS